MDRNKLFKIILALIVIMAVVGLYFCFTPHIYDLNQNISYGHHIIYDIGSQEEYDFYTYTVKASLSGFKEYTDYHVMANFTDENGTARFLQKMIMSLHCHQQMMEKISIWHNMNLKTKNLMWIIAA